MNYIYWFLLFHSLVRYHSIIYATGKCLLDVSSHVGHVVNIDLYMILVFDDSSQFISFNSPHAPPYDIAEAEIFHCL